MQFRSVKRSDFTGGARAVARNMDQILQASRDSATDFTMLAKESIKGRSQERRAAMEAEAAVAKAGLRAFAKTKGTKDNADADTDIQNIKRPAKRMAGVVGALGTLSGYALMAKNAKEDKKWREERALREEGYRQQMLELMRNSTNRSAHVPGTFTPPPRPDLEPIPQSNGSGSGTSSSSSTSGAEEVSAVDPESLGPQRKAIYQAAIDVGFDPQKATLATAIAGGESTWDPTNSTRRSGVYAQTGEDSVGAMQINWGYHKDRGWLQKLGITKREQLFDLKTNMRAAKYLHDQYNDFRDWTVYEEGIYKDFL